MANELIPWRRSYGILLNDDEIPEGLWALAYSYIVDHGHPPRYLLLGRREWHLLNRYSGATDLFIAWDEPDRVTFRGIRIKRLIDESFCEFV
ncbi:MAG TPA: hypothetical protein VKE41_03140 [Roseiflexaceae bacterium]|nr:hypothetical protein [Roseiflexaceae bacterium]